MSTFEVGQRVMVDKFKVWDKTDLTGFYGHVVGLLVGGHCDMVLVNLDGCIANAPLSDDRDDIVTQTKALAFFVDELEHAD